MGSTTIFDFEPYVTKLLPELDNVDTESLINPFGAIRGDPKHRTIVCRHWLLGLCQNGSTCGYLHRLDRSKMPPCKHGKLCKIKKCFLKHVDEQEVVECTFFKQGFCYYGPNCSRRHIKRLPDEIPKDAIIDLGISSGVTNTTTTTTNITSTGGIKKKKGNSDNYKVSLCNHWLLNGTCHFGEECHFAHGEEEIQEGGHQSEVWNDRDIYDATRYRMDAELILPFPLTARISYFLFQAPDLRSLVVSKRRGVWSVPVRLSAEINAALRAYDHVVAYMSVRPLKGIYGIVKIMGPISNPPPHLQHTQMTSEFPVQWMRLVRISMRTVAQLKIGTTGMFVGRTTTDSKFESKVGSEIMYIAYRKPVWDWSAENQYIQAEQYLINQRMMNGEIMPMLSPDALFGPQWIEQQIYGEKKPMISFGGGGGGAGSGSHHSGGGFHMGGGGGGGTRGIMSAVGGGGNSSGNIASVYKYDYPGFIVMGSGPMAEEMFRRSIFGLPPQLKDINIPINSAMFLLDPQLQLLVGIFQAITSLSENIETQAFINWNDPNNQTNPTQALSMLPIQCRFQRLYECPPIPLSDPELNQVFKEHGNGMVPMGGQIPVHETKMLCNLFARRAGIPIPIETLSSMNPPHISGSGGYMKKGGGGGMNVGAGGGGGGSSNNAPGGMIGTIGGSSGGYSDSASYRPPFKFVDEVPINIQTSSYELKKRLLGTNGSTVVQIATEVAGSPRGVKIRIRGIGSGFIENGQQELQQPLHFNVSAENEDLLRRAVEKVKELVARVKFEIEFK